MPAEVRKKLGIGPGSVLEWHEQGDQVVVRRAGQFSSEDIHQALFPDLIGKEVAAVKEGIRQYMRKKHARR